MELQVQTLSADGPAPDRRRAGLDAYAFAGAGVPGTKSRIHGECHATRVLVWANTIAHWMRADGWKIDLEAVRWAAVLHDARRLNDGKDPEHGDRAASWIRGGGVPAVCALGPERRERIAYCCQWHVPADHEAPEMTSELICLKDADALDRVRLASLQVRYLRTGYARVLASHARALFERSEPGGRLRDAAPDWISVRQAAGALGFWSSLRLADYLELVPRHRSTAW